MPLDLVDPDGGPNVGRTLLAGLRLRTGAKRDKR